MYSPVEVYVWGKFACFTRPEMKVERVDIVHDVGRSLNPAVDRGQIEGGFVQGMGWLTTEELVFGKDGRFLSHAPSTYKIPCSSDVPEHFEIALCRWGRQHAHVGDHGQLALVE